MKPDYKESIVNLAASVTRALGGRTPYPELRALPARELRGAKRVVLLVLDGLGHEWLREHGKGSFLERHLRDRMTSVFPPTTAAALTSSPRGCVRSITPERTISPTPDTCTCSRGPSWASSLTGPSPARIAP